MALWASEHAFQLMTAAQLIDKRVKAGPKATQTNRTPCARPDAGRLQVAARLRASSTPTISDQDFYPREVAKATTESSRPKSWKVFTNYSDS